MTTLLSIILYAAAAVGAAGFIAFLVGRFFQVDPLPSEITFFNTKDGWRLALRHYPPREPLEGAPPVVLCPGFGLSATVFDLMEEVSLARFLRDHGHNVWLLDMRGRGHADRPRLWGRRRRTWSFDDFVDFDVPAAIEEVCRLTGASRVQWIGFSAGALAPMAARAEQINDRLASLIGLATTTSFKRQRQLLSPWRTRVMSVLWTPTACRLLAFLVGRLTPPPYRALLNQDNVDGPVFRRALMNGLVRLSQRELEQYARWVELDLFDSQDQGLDYRKNLPRLTVPTLLVSGPRDALCPGAAVEVTMEQMTGLGEGRALMAGRVNGMSCNYGHLDLLLGRNARRDLFPHLLAWLDSHSGATVEQDRPEPLKVAERSPELRPPVEERADPTTRVQLRAEAMMGSMPIQEDPPPAPAPAPRQVKAVSVEEGEDPVEELFKEDDVPPEGRN